MKKQKSLSDVYDNLNAAITAMKDIKARALYGGGDEPKFSFEQKVISAAKQMDTGEPMKDFLDYHEVEQAVKILADIYILTGVKMPEDWL